MVEDRGERRSAIDDRPAAAHGRRTLQRQVDDQRGWYAAGDAKPAMGISPPWRFARSGLRTAAGRSEPKEEGRAMERKLLQIAFALPGFLLVPFGLAGVFFRANFLP